MAGAAVRAVKVLKGAQEEDPAVRADSGASEWAVDPAVVAVAEAVDSVAADSAECAAA